MARRGDLCGGSNETSRGKREIGTLVRGIELGRTTDDRAASPERCQAGLAATGGSLPVGLKEGEIWTAGVEGLPGGVGRVGARGRVTELREATGDRRTPLGRSAAEPEVTRANLPEVHQKRTETVKADGVSRKKHGIPEEKTGLLPAETDEGRPLQCTVARLREAEGYGRE